MTKTDAVISGCNPVGLSSPVKIPLGFFIGCLGHDWATSILAAVLAEVVVTAVSA